MPSHFSDKHISSLGELSLHQVIIECRWVRGGIQLLLLDPGQLPLQLTSVLLEVSIFLVEKNYRIISTESLYGRKGTRITY